MNCDSPCGSTTNQFTKGFKRSNNWKEFKETKACGGLNITLVDTHYKSVSDGHEIKTKKLKQGDLTPNDSKQLTTKSINPQFQNFQYDFNKLSQKPKILQNKRRWRIINKTGNDKAEKDSNLIMIHSLVRGREKVKFERLNNTTSFQKLNQDLERVQKCIQSPKGEDKSRQNKRILKPVLSETCSRFN
ncbi:unnamed protein product [Moneuplotes crassus]|uniref:Uncharacterized protein n=1 Tax=Euplotes crassus TaxID=5936 RepID=A0AAD1UHM0_EUPCR|nr:unnamed protein product [Moneuplotes crassus]